MEHCFAVNYDFSRAGRYIFYKAQIPLFFRSELMGTQHHELFLEIEEK